MVIHWFMNVDWQDSFMILKQKSHISKGILHVTGTKHGPLKIIWTIVFG